MEAKMVMAGLLALTGAASVLTTSPPSPPNPAADTQGDVEISVLTYNVHGLPWPFALHGTRQLREIGAELGRMRREGRQPDVVLVQEGFSGGMRQLIERSGYRYWAQGPGRGDRSDPSPKFPRLAVRYRQAGEGWGKFTGAGLYVLSDSPVIRLQSHPYSACAGWDCLANKGVMLAHVSLRGVPGGIDVANTHLNSRRAAKVPLVWSLAAYDRQVTELKAFLARRGGSAAPLLVGGDFNVKHAPDRYSDLVSGRPFDVVTDRCPTGLGACEPDHARQSLWMDSQDLQAFANDGPVTIQPVRADSIFDAKSTPRLSDHDGYLVRYRLSWNVKATDQPIPISTAHSPQAADHAVAR